MVDLEFCEFQICLKAASKFLVRFFESLEVSKNESKIDNVGVIVPLGTSHFRVVNFHHPFAVFVIDTYSLLHPAQGHYHINIHCNYSQLDATSSLVPAHPNVFCLRANCLSYSVPCERSMGSDIARAPEIQ